MSEFDDAFAVFSPDGRMMGNLTSNQGQPPAPQITGATLFGNSSNPVGVSTPPLPAAGGAAGASIAKAAQSAGITGGATPPDATTGAPNASTGASAANNWFARGAIVILGFVFVAVGLSQFGILQKITPDR